MPTPPANDDIRNVFDRVTSLAADTAELREREALELRALAVALADFAREHPLTDLAPPRLSPRARLQSRLQLGGVPAYIGDGLYLAPNGDVVTRAERGTRQGTAAVSAAVVVASLAAISLAPLPSVVALVTGLALIPGQSLWNGATGAISHFRPLPPHAERGALAVLRRTLGRLEREVHGTRRLDDDAR